MKFLIRIIPVCIFILISYPIFAQLRVKSDFDREAGQLNVEITNKSPYLMLFLEETLLSPPSVSIESFDSEGNAIEVLQRSPSKDGEQYLFGEAFFLLSQDNSHQLSFSINPDKTKGKPEYFLVTFYLPFRLMQTKNTWWKTLIDNKSRLTKGFESLRLIERFEFDAPVDDKPVRD